MRGRRRGRGCRLRGRAWRPGGVRLDGVGRCRGDGTRLGSAVNRTPRGYTRAIVLCCFEHRLVVGANTFAVGATRRARCRVLRQGASVDGSICNGNLSLCALSVALLGCETQYVWTGRRGPAASRSRPRRHPIGGAGFVPVPPATTSTHQRRSRAHGAYPRHRHAAPPEEVRTMRLALIAPPTQTVPPAALGGRDQVRRLAAGLADAGHHVTLIGAGLGGLGAGRCAVVDTDPTAGQHAQDGLIDHFHAVQAGKIVDVLDVQAISDHTRGGYLPASARRLPTAQTVYAPPPPRWSPPGPRLPAHVGLVAVSLHQQRHAPGLPWWDVIYPAIPLAEHRCQPTMPGHACTWGRCCPAAAPAWRWTPRTRPGGRSRWQGPRRAATPTPTPSGSLAPGSARGTGCCPRSACGSGGRCLPGRAAWSRRFWTTSPPAWRSSRRRPPAPRWSGWTTPSPPNWSAAASRVCWSPASAILAQRSARSGAWTPTPRRSANRRPAST